MARDVNRPVTPYLVAIRIKEIEREERHMYCKHTVGLWIDPCCGDCGHADAVYRCIDCDKPQQRDEWEYEFEKDWDSHYVDAGLRYGT